LIYGVQMSDLCRHSKSYEHKDVSRHAETVFKIVYQ